MGTLQEKCNSVTVTKARKVTLLQFELQVLITNLLQLRLLQKK